MKKLMVMILSIVLIMATAVGCGNGGGEKSPNTTPGKQESSEDKKENNSGDKEGDKAESGKDEAKYILSFSSKNLEGEDVDTTFFENSKVTMVNFWGTYCGPCKEEMPMLQEIYDEYKDKGGNILGIVIDATSDEVKEVAKKIVEVKGAEFENVVPDSEMINGILQDVQGVPTTYFVNSEGEILGGGILGAVPKEQYIEEIEKRLKMVEAEEKEVE